MQMPRATRVECRQCKRQQDQTAQIRALGTGDRRRGSRAGSQRGGGAVQWRAGGGGTFGRDDDAVKRECNLLDPATAWPSADQINVTTTLLMLHDAQARSTFNLAAVPPQPWQFAIHNAAQSRNLIATNTTLPISTSFCISNVRIFDPLFNFPIHVNKTRIPFNYTK